MATTQTKFVAVLKDVNGLTLKTVEFLADDLPAAQNVMRKITKGHDERGAPSTNTWTITYTITNSVAYP